MSGRREQRFESALAITLDGGQGVSRNVSASGIYFETEVPLRERSRLNFSVRFRNPEGEPMHMKCEARIVRIEELDGNRVGVGARIEEFKVERMEAGA